jgi:glutaredoxin-related protein
MINIYYLEYCPYSQNALQILDRYKINYSKIESSNNKDERKQLYPTFPQIYWNKHLIGGNDNFTKIIQTLQKNKEPYKSNEWSKKEWYNFLINIAEKI